MVTTAIDIAANQFLDNPGNFLKYNVVRWVGPSPDAHQTNCRVGMVGAKAIDPLGATGGRRRTSILRRKVDTPHYNLVYANVSNFVWQEIAASNPPTFDAIWSGYVTGASADAVLPAIGGPSIMLTATLTGCTVVCSPNPNGGTNARFSHYNLSDQGADGTLDRATMQAIAEAQYEGLEHRILTKEQYNSHAKHSGKCEVTVVGHRLPNGCWEFWAQSLEDKDSGWQIRNVQRVT